LSGSNSDPSDRAGDVEPVSNERRDRIITGVVTVGPIVSLLFVAWQLWHSLLGWNDLFDFLVVYVLTGLGVTVGFHRLLTHHHVTYSVNSLCHFFGRRRFATGDESRNLAWLASLSLGEAWHNNHHAFPTSAEHGMRRWELDFSALTIRALEKVGLVWDVVRVDPERQATRLALTRAS
jgi:fatty-acid desaturase